MTITQAITALFESGIYNFGILMTTVLQMCNNNMQQQQQQQQQRFILPNQITI